MSIRNFPKIPKIILRKPYEQVKRSKTQNVNFCFVSWTDPWDSRNQVSAAALKSWNNTVSPQLRKLCWGPVFDCQMWP